MYLEETVAQKAVELTGFGKFNIKIMAVCALMYLNCAFCITSVGFVVPTAACDFQMTTIDKGRINAAPMLGMVVGTGIWGYMADLKGRRLSLLLSLFLQFIVDALASIVPSYWAFVFLKFLSGIGVTGQLSILFPYLGEFQPIKYRHRILSWMELFWAVGVIVVALFAWAVIPLSLDYRHGFIRISSWNVFVFVSSLPALVVGLWLLVLPETPKYLAENGQRVLMLKVLTRMYVENTGGTSNDFREKLLTNPLPSISALVSEPVGLAEPAKSAEQKKLTKREKLKELINSSKSQARTLLQKPYAKRLCTSGSIMFCMTSTYYSLMTWFPELFQRFVTFERAFPGEFASVCEVSKRLAASNSTLGLEQLNDPYGCDIEMDTSVYVNSALLGAACIPCAILLPLTVNKLGYRVYLFLTAIVASAVTVSFFFVKTSTQNVILSCIFEAFTSLNISVIFCLLVDLFPTNLRVMATAITLFIGRIGSLFGNMLFGYLIDEYCTGLIIAMASQLFLAAVLCWAAPSRDKVRKIQGYPSVKIKNKAFDPS